MNRRQFIALIASLAGTAAIPAPAFAESDDTRIEMTDSVAIKMAEGFAASFDPDLDVEAYFPCKFYDTTGQAIGYIVHYERHGDSYGYVVFDNSDDSLISEFSFGDDALSPCERIFEAAEVSLVEAEAIRLFKTGDFTYTLLNGNNAVNNYGEACSLGSLPLSLESESDSTPTSPSWNSVFIDYPSSSWTMSDFNSIPQFIAFNESYVEDATGKYACLVSAMMATVIHYGAETWFSSAAYNSLWSMSLTTASSIRNGVTYGSTPIASAGPTVCNYCDNKGVNISYSHEDDPSYSFFTGAIDQGNVAIVHLGINLPDTGRSGHSMAVEGYCTLAPGSGGSNIQALVVFDGWNSSARYLNYGYADYTDKAGTRFSR